MGNARKPDDWKTSLATSLNRRRDYNLPRGSNTFSRAVGRERESVEFFSHLSRERDRLDVSRAPLGIFSWEIISPELSNPGPDVVDSTSFPVRSDGSNVPYAAASRESILARARKRSPFHGPVRTNRELCGRIINCATLDIPTRRLLLARQQGRK